MRAVRTVTAHALIASFACVVACHRTSPAPSQGGGAPYVPLATTNHGDPLSDADVDLVLTAEGVRVAPDGPVFPVHLEAVDAAAPARPLLLSELESSIRPGNPKSARLFIDGRAPYGVVASTLFTLGDLGVRKRCLVAEVHGAPACIVPGASTKGTTVAAIVRDYGVVVASSQGKYDAACSSSPGVAAARTATGYEWTALGATARCALDSLGRAKMLPAALSVSAAFDVPFATVLGVVDSFDDAQGAQTFGSPQFAVWTGPDP